MSANTRGKIVLALALFAVPLAFMLGMLTAPSPISVHHDQIGHLTVTYVNGCAVTSRDRDGYTATAPAGVCLTGADITLMPHTR